MSDEIFFLQGANSSPVVCDIVVRHLRPEMHVSIVYRALHNLKCQPSSPRYTPEAGGGGGGGVQAPKYFISYWALRHFEIFIYFIFDIILSVLVEFH